MKSLFLYIKEYGLWIFLLTATSRILRKSKLFGRKSINMYDRMKHNVISKWLWKRYASTIDATLPVNNSDSTHYADRRMVFVFWWQGESEAPAIVKACIQSIRENEPDTVVITKENFRMWVTLPEYIIEKMEKGLMGLANFSDIVRFYLLYNYGGAWVDATCFMTRPIPTDLFDYKFYSCKKAFDGSLKFRWTSFFMIAKKESIVAKNMLTFYYKYWQDHNTVITYLVLDCWMENLRKHSNLEDMIEAMPDEGKRIFHLIAHINDVYDAMKFKDIVNYYYVYKLTYKQKFAEKSQDGKMTNYGYILSKLTN